MTAAFPWVLAGALVAVAGVIAAHLLSVRKPPTLWLPTARFVPEQTVRAVSRARTPSDRALLAVRVLTVLVMGAALAGVTYAGATVPVTSLLVLDRTVVTDSGAWRTAMQSAVAEQAPVAAVVVDGRVVHARDVALETFVDTLSPAQGSDETNASLAAALLMARRAAPGVAEGADSVRLVIVSELREDVATPALDAVRSTWPGRVTVVPVEAGAGSGVDTDADAPAPRGTVRDSVTVRADGDDVIAAAFARWGDLPAARARVVRDVITREDSAFAESGGVLVAWAPSAIPPGWSARGDTMQAMIANGRAIVTPFHRSAAAPAEPADARAVVWWADGSAAVSEEALGAGCVRWVGFEPPAGDVMLGMSARGVLSALAGACGARGTLGAPAPLGAEQVTRLAGDGPLARAQALRDATTSGPSPATRWLLLSALVLLVVESVMRMRSPRSTGARGTDARAVRDASAGAPEIAA